MNPRIRLLSCILPLAFLTGCPPLPPELVTCEEADACDTTGLAATTGDWTPTTSDGVQTVTGDDPDASAGSTAPAEETGDEPGGTTDEPVLPPLIINSVVIPDYIDDNGELNVEVTTQSAEGVTMLLDTGELLELTPVGPGQFAGKISAYSGFDNGKHTVVFTPWREMIVGESVEADYVIALPLPGSETYWEADDDGIQGNVAAIAVLPDGRPVELGTYQEMGAPRCYLRLRTKQGKQEKPMDFVPLLASAYCLAVDLKIDRETGRLTVLVERKNGDDTVWWAGEMSVWGKGLKNIGIGDVGDTALALAARPDVVAVCGTRAVAKDTLDALAVLLRPNALPEPRVFDYWPANKPNKAGTFAETAHDCAFAGDTLVLVGTTWGRHEEDVQLPKRDRLMVIESNLAADEPAWTVAGLDQGVQTRALALDIDEQGRFILAGYSCFDTCEPVGEVRVYAPGGTLVAPTASLGPLGSAWFGPHDIAWSPAGYAVVALGELQGQTFVFKVQAVAPGAPLPLWTFPLNNKQGLQLQLALAVAVGPYGEVYAGGIGATDHPAFARIGS